MDIATALGHQEIVELLSPEEAIQEDTATTPEIVEFLRPEEIIQEDILTTQGHQEIFSLEEAIQEDVVSTLGHQEIVEFLSPEEIISASEEVRICRIAVAI